MLPSMGVKLLANTRSPRIETRGDKVGAVVTNADARNAADIKRRPAVGGRDRADGGLDLPIVPIRRQWLTTTPCPQY